MHGWWGRHGSFLCSKHLSSICNLLDIKLKILTAIHVHFFSTGPSSVSTLGRGSMHPSTISSSRWSIISSLSVALFQKLTHYDVSPTWSYTSKSMNYTSQAYVLASSFSSPPICCKQLYQTYNSTVYHSTPYSRQMFNYNVKTFVDNFNTYIHLHTVNFRCWHTTVHFLYFALWSNKYSTQLTVHSRTTTHIDKHGPRLPVSSLD